MKTILALIPFLFLAACDIPTKNERIANNDNFAKNATALVTFPDGRVLKCGNVYYNIDSALSDRVYFIESPSDKGSVSQVEQPVTVIQREGKHTKSVILIDGVEYTPKTK